MTKVKFSRFDAAEFLDTEEDIAAFLSATFDEAGDDPAAVIRALGTVARARNMSKLAREAGLTREGLYKALSGEGNPSWTTIVKVMHALGLKLAVAPDRPVVKGKAAKNISGKNVQIAGRLFRSKTSPAARAKAKA